MHFTAPAHAFHGQPNAPEVSQSPKFKSMNCTNGITVIASYEHLLCAPWSQGHSEAGSRQGSLWGGGGCSGLGLNPVCGDATRAP